MKRIFSLILLTAFLFSCNKKSALGSCEDVQTKTVELNNCTEKMNTDSPHEICFTALNDSRCPINSDCVWQGVAIAKFTLKTNGSQHELTLATSKFPGLPSTDTTVAGFSVKLMNVTPYPGSQVQEPTRAILQITR